MSLSGLCEICQRPTVEHTCDRCGNLVCDRHFEQRLGVCAECGAEMGHPGSPERADDRSDDVDTYQF